ncbi:MAG: transcription-repair coupling factor [Geminicoccaceae bacterium]|nr:MAG: transcription-repair coupling factor [Geminicoccaceae bacterium]
MEATAELKSAPSLRLPARSLAGAPEGADALFTAARLGATDCHVHIARDSTRGDRFAAVARFTRPDLQTLALPGWDCLPYDRVSPTAEVMAQRLETLAALAGGVSGPLLLTVSVNAILQYVPPPEAIRAARVVVTAGDRIDRDQLIAKLEGLGYRRCSTVVEAGEYAVRGSLIDVFATGGASPVRLDFFGKEVEAIRTFDALTQRSLGKIDALSLTPSSEVMLDPPSIERFKVGFLQRFGAVTDDPLVEAVTAGRAFAGMEHWLPLFYERLATLFDYLPASFTWSLDDQAEAALQARIETITEHYQARLDPPVAGSPFATPYRALEPERLYLDAGTLARCLRGHEGLRFHAGDAFGGDGEVLQAGGRVGRDFAPERKQRDVPLFDAVIAHLQAHENKGFAVVVAARSEGARQRLEAMLTDAGLAGLPPVRHLTANERYARCVSAVLPIEHGFVHGDLVVLSEDDILGDRLKRTRPSKRKSDKLIAEISGLAVGDLVVHASHGIGRFDGLEAIDVGGAPHDCIRLVYAGNDKLFVPVENLEVLSRYGSGDDKAHLDKLGGAGWQARKAQVKQRIKELADKLIKVAAERALRRGLPLEKTAGLYEEFCARFPFEETDDQLNAIDAVIADMASGRPMDRLVCGDVGFGKTEVALRAAFVAAMAGRQVAVLAPTTLLVRQHFRVFQARFQGFPLRVGMVSRFVPVRTVNKIKEELASGQLDIVIGTHALLSKTVSFKDLGLLIVDEEQHFGVTHKERLKELRAEVHVLTMTATPIPRTLQMALGGLKDLSIIATAPVDRLAVRSFVMPADPVVLREALMREHFRGGQSFYVCPRIEDQARLARDLEKLLPELKIAVANGRMAGKELEEVMTAFDDGAVDVLLATNIIESGLDIPRANTMIVHRADLFGLSQLYQLRGRIGRGKVRGYAYFTVPPNRVLRDTAERRLKVMETIDGLGAGFQVASHDMDIRGHGNLLGDEQSGHIKEVGFELYQQLLEEALEEARQSGFSDAPSTDREWTPQIAIDVPAMMPEGYVADLDLRLALYRRLASLETVDDIEAFAAELIDRFGNLPAETDNLLALVRLKQACRRANVEKLDAGPKGIVLAFRGNQFAHPERLLPLIADSRGRIRVRPDHKLVIARETQSPAERLAEAHAFVGKLAELAA